MTEELESLKRVVENLDSGKFKYILTGSMAMSFYSVPRMTRDSDIVIQLMAKDIDRFYELFSENFFLDINMIRDCVKQKMMFNIFDKETLFKIDCIIKLENEYEDLKFQRKLKMKINEFELFVISVEDLIISKLYWAKDSESDTQLNDIRQLLKRNIDIDKKFIDYWINKLELSEIHSKL